MAFVSMEHPTELYDQPKDVCLERVKLDEASGIEYKMIQKLLHARRTVHSKVTKSDSPVTAGRWCTRRSFYDIIRFRCRRWKMAYTKLPTRSVHIKLYYFVPKLYAVGQGVVVHPRPLCWQHHAFLS